MDETTARVVVSESGNTKHCANRAAQALRLAAAHQLARLIYAMLSKGEEYTDAGQEAIPST